MDVRSVSFYKVYSGRVSSENVARWTRANKEGLGKRLVPLPVRGLLVFPRKNCGKQVQICASWCILSVKYAFMGSRIEVCMGMENHTGI